MAEMETYTTGFVASQREKLGKAILENTDTSASILDLILVDIPLHFKFRVLNFCDVLRQNSESTESLKKLILGLNILEKYGRHLLKPEESRSNMWRHIKYNNAIYSTRVDKLKCGREIMRLMGYTENRPDGVAFPDGGEPDQRTVLNLVIDIILGRKELETYLKGEHRFPKYIKECIVFKITDNVTEHQADHVQATTDIEPSAGLDFQPETLPALSLMETMSIPRKNEYITQAIDNPQHMALAVGDSDHIPKVLAYPADQITQVHGNSDHLNQVLGYPENMAQQISNSGGTGGQVRKSLHQNFSTTQQMPVMSSPKPSLNVGLKLPDESCTQPENAKANGTEVKTPSIVCDICGDMRAEVICRQCDSKQLCRGCHIKWHKHPKRQNHQIELIRPSTSAETTPQSNFNVGFKEKQVPSISQSGMVAATRGTLAVQGTIQQQQQQQEYQLHDQQGSRPAFSFQPFTQMPSFQHYGPGEGISGKDRSTIMCNALTNRQYEVPSVPYHRVNNSDMEQTLVHLQHLNTTHNQILGEERKSQFLPEGQQQVTSGHMSSSNITNFSHQRYPQSVSGYPLVTPASQIYGPTPNLIPLSHPQMLHYLSNARTDPRFDTGENNVTHGRDHIVASTLVLSSSSTGMPLMSSSTIHQPEEQNYNVIGAGLRSPPPNLSDEKSGLSLNITSAESSRLLKRIKNIPNLERRISRLDIDLENLTEDLKEWDNRINEIMLTSPSFFQDEEYISLNKKKRKHLSDVKILESYRKELENDIAKAHVNELRLQELYNRHPLSRVINTETQGQTSPGSSSSQPSAPTLSPRDHQILPDTMAQAPKGPDSTKYQPVRYSPAGVHIESPKSVEETPHLKLSSLERSENRGPDIPEDVVRALVLDQSPFDQPVQQMNVPVAPNIQEKQKITYPPDVRNVQQEVNKDILVSNNVTPEQGAAGVQIKSGQSAPDLQQVKHASPPIRSKSVPAVRQWQCEHCTFINDATSKVCSMCYKTTDNPKILSSAQQSQEEKEQLVQCEHCTFLNKQYYTKCEMCGKTATQTKVRDDEPKDVELQGAGSSKERLGHARDLDQIIKNDQDQVYWEKKAAQEQFDKRNLSGNSQASSSSEQVTVVENPVTGGRTDIPTNMQTTLEQEPVCTKSANGPAEKISNDSTTQPEIATIQKKVELQPAQLMHDLGSGAIPKNFKGSGDFIRSMEQIELKINQERMGLDGHELMMAIKMAEELDFEMDEIEMALKRCCEDDMKLVDWLKEKWNSMITMVEDMTAEKGKTLTPNNVGDMSREEVKAALLHCDGIVENAVRKCIEDRQNKYKKITDSGQYACEDILTALFQNHGDVDEALDQLNQSVIQAYIDRLWDGENSLMGRQAMLAGAAARQDDLNRSVCNSVVGEEGFQAIVKDTGTDRNRRIRMVFVEGKLMSWGRAEIVIRILEENVLRSPDPLDCMLEDIIDAVRNCRDRRSSLVYLQQECGICMGNYPMSKIRNLGVCNCKLCESCLKQCFEIAIRERFVRNWGCPLCEAPGLGNDDTNDANYFDFLHLLLERLVSKDVMELYDTKLRDWHLQKDPNFRWCAHCASGFLWDRPQVLAMECHFCRMKTCFLCKIKWEDQHEGLTCEQFEQWKIDNDPERQAKGVKLYLEENGIDCPSCKMRYSLAKGGCMHFKCPQCGHEFCSGCSQAFLQQGACRLLESCRNKGLHCHHPRDCFYYMRDYDVEELQKLLKKRQVPFNIETPPTQADKQTCPVMEQKEFGSVKKDEACGRPTQKGHAGLCETHYKEYLVGLINKYKIDPVIIMKVEELKILIQRNEKPVPDLRPGENEAQYRNRLIQFIKEKIQIQR